MFTSRGRTQHRDLIDAAVDTLYLSFMSRGRTQHRDLIDAAIDTLYLSFMSRGRTQHRFNSTIYLHYVGYYKEVEIVGGFKAEIIGAARNLIV